MLEHILYVVGGHGAGLMSCCQGTCSRIRIRLELLTAVCHLCKDQTVKFRKLLCRIIIDLSRENSQIDMQIP